MNKSHKRSMLRATAAFSLLLSGSSLAAAQDVITFAAATFAEAGRGELLRAWVEEFNTSQSEVKVEPIAIAASNVSKTIFIQMGGGGGPDIVRFDQTDFVAAVKAGHLLPIDNVLGETDYNFNATASQFVVDGVRYGIPFESSNYVLLYNKDLLPEPPTTFEEFIEAAKATTKDGAFGFAYRATMPERPGFWQDLCNFIYGFGGRFSDGENLTLNSPAVVAGVEAYKQVYDANVIPKGADAATYRRMFWEGKVAMNIDNGGVAGIFNAQAPELPFAAAPSPFPYPSQGMVLTVAAINSHSKNPEAAAKFLRWALEDESQQKLQSILGASSVAIDVSRPDEEVQKYAWYPVFDARTEHAVPQIVAGFELETPILQQIILEQVLKVLQAGVDPQEAMNEAQQRALKEVGN